MKKLLSLLTVFILLSGASLAAPQNKVQIEKGYITVSANSSDEVSPNIAKVIFYIETQNKNQATAVEENKKVASEVIATIKKNLNLETDIIKTINYSVSPNYIYSGNKKTFDTYVVLNSVEVKTKNPKNIALIIDEALKAGATRVSGLTYTLDFDNYDYSLLIKDAVKIAKNRANATASALGVKIVGIKNVTTACDSENAVRYYTNVLKSSGVDSSSSYTEEGLVKVNASVNIEFWVK